MKKTLLTIIGLAALSTPVGFGQVTIGALNAAYTENFNGLGSTPNNDPFTYVDNTTLAGWTVNSEEMDSNLDEYFTNTGSSNGGEVYSYGAEDAADRALGYLGSGGNDYFNAAITLTNGTGSTINEISLSYIGEQWRSGAASGGNNNFLEFSYQIGTSITIPASTSQTGWTTVASLNFTAPQPTATAGALDGNLAANQTSFSNVSISGLSWVNGEDLVLRWVGNDGAGSDAGLAIDNFSVTAIPEPGTFLMFGLGAAAIIIRRKMGKLSKI